MNWQEPEVALTEFIRDDGRTLRIVPGFRDRVLSSRSSTSPRADWTDADFNSAAEIKLRRGRRLFDELKRHFDSLHGAHVLEIGCGDGTNCLLLAHYGVQRTVGIDLQLPLLEAGENGDQRRRLVRRMLQQLGYDRSLEETIARLPVQFLPMDATCLAFVSKEFDLVLSRSVMEHIVPVEKALEEMARVVRPGGLIRHSIDPYFWVRGCHKRGLVDLPWAHARLSLDEYRRFVRATEGEATAIRRCSRLQTLNRFTLAQWRAVMKQGSFEILEWKEERSELSEQLLQENPEVTETLHNGLQRHDLVCGRIEVWLRRKPTWKGKEVVE